MKTIVSISELRQNLTRLKADGAQVGFVPTMGALHDGHLSLIRQVSEHCSVKIVSIFVNPKQFGPGEDFATYPRTLKDDLDKLRVEKVDIVYLPTTADLYPEGFQTFVINRQNADILCGAHRPGHFDGVLTIVLKLLHIVKPEFACFGRKDYQQLTLIKQMCRDLNCDVEILSSETLREADGLALSSRNRKLSPEARSLAPRLFEALSHVKEVFHEGQRSAESLVQQFKQLLKSAPEFELQYAEIRGADDLELQGGVIEKPAVFFVAAFLHGVRLIDNIDLEPS